jgi:hypothetical protein
MSQNVPGGTEDTHENISAKVGGVHAESQTWNLPNTMRRASALANKGENYFFRQESNPGSPACRK